MTPFTRAELLALPSSDLADLLGLVDGDGLSARAEKLGLDMSNTDDQIAVLTAVQGSPDIFSPPIGAGQAGVRQYLTPAGPSLSAQIDGQGDPALTDLSTVQPDLDSAKEIAALMDRSAATGEPFLAGTFAMYATPTGEVVMVTEGIGDGIRRSIVPRQMVRTALNLMAGKGGKMHLIKGLFGRG